MLFFKKHQYPFTKYKINLDFAPDADANTNPDNIVIGNRSFGSDPNLVSDMVGAYIEGLNSHDIMATIKHFPGHGDTKGDTHKGYVRQDKNWDQLIESDLIPFKNNLDNTDLVMVAHITVPKVTDDGLPSSLSKEMITDRLRGQLGYDGIVITDALDMGAIVNQYSPTESVVEAFNAGADILLMPANFREAYDGLVDAIERGDISEEKLDESVLKILHLKVKYNLF